MHIKRLLAVAIAVAVATFASACSDSSASSSKSGGSMKIGVICSCTGFSASSTGDFKNVADAWARYVNANGGINGHDVEVIFKDDAGDAATALRAAQTLVQQDKVQAIVDVSDQDQAFQKYIDTTDIPVTGGSSFTGPMSSDPNFFPTGGQLVPALGYGEGAMAKDRGKTTFAAVVCSESPVCGAFTDPFGESLKNVVGGMELVYSTKIASNAPNFTAQCVAAKNAGADAMFIGANAETDLRVLDDCAAQGYKPLAFVPGGSAIKSLTSSSHADGLLVPQFSLPIADDSTPGAKLFHQVIDTYAPQIKTKATWGDANMWPFAGLELFKKVAMDANLTPSSSGKDVKAGLYQLKDETLGGIAPPLNYVEGKPTTVPCWFEEEFDAGKATLPKGPEPQCVPADKLEPLFKAFGG